MSHTLVLVFTGDPKDLFDALRHAPIVMQQAQLNGESTDINNLPAHRSDDVRARTQSDHDPGVAHVSLMAKEGNPDPDNEQTAEGEAEQDPPKKGKGESVKAGADDEAAEDDSTQASLQAIRFGSVAASRLADETNLTVEEFRASGIDPSGIKGFTVGDVRKVITANMVVTR